MMVEEFTPEEREQEYRRLQGFLDAYKRYPVSVMAEFPDPTVDSATRERLVSPTISLDDFWQLW